MRRPTLGKSSADIDYDAIFREIWNAEPRAAAVIAASYLESVLRFAISFRLIDMVREQQEYHLYGVAGPLNTFSQAIELGYALGLYGKLVYADLGVVRVIRNAFAHDMRSINFDTPEIAAAISKLSFLETERLKDDEAPSAVSSRPNRLQYIMTCERLAAALGRTEAISPPQPPLP